MRCGNSPAADQAPASRPCSPRPLTAAAACRLPLFPLPPQVPTFQPTQGDADLGLDAALSQLHFQDATEEAGAEQEQPAELPEWACA